ncbi:MAG: hypothetical protein A3G59_02745 [Candidatus Taylorbacteria bacterium RIFCSPLOWO2_12_FULL_47_20]|uniref:Uncharacterized protein n=2 Tax=Candidatus Tayloriibacteriota TaxID=1817919 RepID=A0A1G2P4T5_9BACT|nr:MAG: hypothetical protein A3H68_00690 [Candidatus Taylorbacteria bacterium RIFCSPLOWO2_02_FULL_46_40]OHA43273.1 MAG: hypothetical protein A3G59_02745 [Candidatus Taylorbacteria bacterium RIFCSPLOWO2_12_FULL_47_20]
MACALKTAANIPLRLNINNTPAASESFELIPARYDRAKISKAEKLSTIITTETRLPPLAVKKIIIPASNKHVKIKPAEVTTKRVSKSVEGTSICVNAISRSLHPTRSTCDTITHSQTKKANGLKDASALKSLLPSSVLYNVRSDNIETLFLVGINKSVFYNGVVKTLDEPLIQNPARFRAGGFA